MRRTLASFLMATTLATTFPALADDNTVKCDEQVFKDLGSSAAGRTLDLGARKGAAAPVYEETVVVEPEPLAPSLVQSVVNGKVGEVQYCYERHTRGAKNAASEVTLRFVINPRGQATQIKVDVTGTRPKGLEKCIVASVKKWRFAENNVQTEVDIPFVFGEAGQAL